MPRSRKPAERKNRRRPPRVEALASLPLFHRLENRKVVLAGGTDAAAWKAELLAAAGAHVHIYAEELEDGFSALLHKASGTGRFVHHAHIWSAASFENAALAIADAATEGEAQAFYCAARAAGVPVNVIDKPRFCAFQFGSIVNRSPVVIGISTNGVAPILGQAIRRRVEALLPSTLTGWAQLAGDIRARVLKTLSAGAERRRFWERFTDLAFSSRAAPDAGTSAALEDILQEATHAGTGRITFVGAGPGDAEHLTLKAMRALQSADVIFYDDGIDDMVLELARREADRVPVDRRTDRDDNRLIEHRNRTAAMVDQGKHVVRIKPGSLMDAGAADQELRHFVDAGLPVTVVPGVGAQAAWQTEGGYVLARSEAPTLATCQSPASIAALRSAETSTRVFRQQSLSPDAAGRGL